MDATEAVIDKKQAELDARELEEKTARLQEGLATKAAVISDLQDRMARLQSQIAEFTIKSEELSAEIADLTEIADLIGDEPLDAELIARLRSAAQRVMFDRWVTSLRSLALSLSESDWKCSSCIVSCATLHRVGSEEYDYCVESQCAFICGDQHAIPPCIARPDRR